MLGEMGRKVLLILDNSDEYDRAVEVIKQIIPDGAYGFSANVGDHGGFVTYHRQTWNRWCETVEAMKGD